MKEPKDWTPTIVMVVIGIIFFLILMFAPTQPGNEVNCSDRPFSNQC